VTLVAVLVVTHALAVAAGYLIRRYRTSLFAENNHWLAEDIEAIKGADLDADVAAERALRLSGEHTEIGDDLDPEPWVSTPDLNGWAAAIADHEDDR
jgi:hypothetical protein